MEKTKKYVFLVHWVELWNLALPFWKRLNEARNKKFMILLLLPLYIILFPVSIYFLLSRKAYDIVDGGFEFEFKKMKFEGQIWIIRNVAWHFLFRVLYPRINYNIKKAVLDAQASGAELVGLGALTKDIRVNNGGLDIKKELGGKLKIPLVHGDTLTTATVFYKIMNFFIEGKIMMTDNIFIIGPTSKIGSALSILLARTGFDVWLYTSSYRRFKELCKRAGSASKRMHYSDNLNNGKFCRIWITGKAKPKGRRLVKHLPENSFVFNFSVPNPLNRSCLEKKNCVLYEAGLIGYKHKNIPIHFHMRLFPGQTYSCNVAAMLALIFETGEELGEVDPDEVEYVCLLARHAGFILPI